MAVTNRKLPACLVRFTAHQRLQHALMAISVLMLIFTGFPIKYAGQAWAQTIVNLFGSFETMFLVHLTFGVLMLLSSAYHLVWLVGLFAVKGPVTSMVPVRKDLKDAIAHLKYLLGLSHHPPQFDRYTWLEKFEYYAVFWGIFVMGSTGAMLWFPNIVIKLLPRWVLDVSRVVHSNEAFVCMLAVFIGHFFAAHFNPRVFPSSKVWLTGEISMEHLAAEHPLEYQRLAKEGKLPEQAHPHSRAPNLALVVIELVIYLALFVFLLSTFLKLLLI